MYLATRGCGRRWNVHEEYLAKLERDLAQGVLHVLLLSAVGRHGPIHGYGVIRAMAEATNGAVQFKEGTIYPILNELERVGVVKSRWAAGESGPQRKYYQLTPEGRRVLAGARERWTRVRDALDAQLPDGGS